MPKSTVNENLQKYKKSGRELLKLQKIREGHENKSKKRPKIASFVKKLPQVYDCSDIHSAIYKNIKTIQFTIDFFSNLFKFKFRKPWYLKKNRF